MRRVTYLLLFLAVSYCLHPSLGEAGLRETVFVSILPQKFFLEQVAYEPKPSQMRQLAESRAYFAIGVPFENAWLDKIRGGVFLCLETLRKIWLKTATGVVTAKTQ